MALTSREGNFIGKRAYNERLHVEDRSRRFGVQGCGHKDVASTNGANGAYNKYHTKLKGEPGVD